MGILRILVILLYLVILTNKLDFKVLLRSPIVMQGRRGGIARFNTNVPLNSRIRDGHINVNQIQGAYKVVRETISSWDGDTKLASGHLSKVFL